MSTSGATGSGPLILFPLTQAAAFQAAARKQGAATAERFANTAAATALNATAGVTAVAQTALSALATIIYSPAMLMGKAISDRYARLTQFTADSANGAVEAAKRTFGFGQETAEDKKASSANPAQAQQSIAEQAREFATQALQWTKDHKFAIAGAATAFVATSVATYHFGPKVLEYFKNPQLPTPKPGPTPNLTPTAQPQNLVAPKPQPTIKLTPVQLMPDLHKLNGTIDFCSMGQDSNSQQNISQLSTVSSYAAKAFSATAAAAAKNPMTAKRILITGLSTIGFIVGTPVMLLCAIGTLNE